MTFVHVDALKKTLSGFWVATGRILRREALSTVCEARRRWLVRSRNFFGAIGVCGVSSVAGRPAAGRDVPRHSQQWHRRTTLQVR